MFDIVLNHLDLGSIIYKLVGYKLARFPEMDFTPGESAIF